MSWTAAEIPDQQGRIAVVTGSNTGLGLEIATKLAEHHATVVMACRNTVKAAQAAGAVRAEMPSARVEVRALDLADLASVASFAAAFKADYDRLDLLINNAGLMAVDQSTTVDGYETQFQVNFLGAFALTQLLRSTVETTPHSRIATMSSFAHRSGRINFDDLMGEREYRRWGAYKQSKLANMLFTNELQHQLAKSGSNSIAVAAHPGVTFTGLGTEGNDLTNRLAAGFMKLSQSVSAAALPMLRAATAFDVRGGDFYGPRFRLMGPAVREMPSRRARNTADARRLWVVAQALVERADDRT